jgi:hypothetical protein
LNLTYGYREPFAAITAGQESFTWDRCYPTLNSFFRRGAVLINSTTGTVTGSGPYTGPPSPTGTLSSSAGPPPAAVTFGTSVSAGAPAASYWVYLAYTASTTALQTSQVGGPYIVNAPAGYVPTVNVSATGAPTLAAQYAVYAGYNPTYIAQQSASTTATALGATYTFATTLANYTAATQAASNVQSGIIGLAAADSNTPFNSGPGGATTVGNTSLFGATQSYPPLDSLGAFGVPIVKAQGTVFEFSLKQAYYGSLNNTSAGLTLDAASGWFVVDNTASACGTILAGIQGPPPFFGGIGDFGARVRFSFTTTDLA